MNKVLTKDNKSDIIIQCENRDGDMTVITRLKRAFGRCENVPRIYELPPLSAFNTGRSASVMSLMSGNFFCNSGGTVDFIHPDFFRVIFIF